VLKGDMSLIGPRPTSFEASTYKLWQTERLDAVPGMSGLWQIYGRAQTEFTDRLRLDIAYIEHRCMALDIELLIRTVGAVFRGRGAH
jgi:lipopolysaccharide/colanic/teichoic acid biosynthesis glycosyltransferase